jgi:Bacterial PH domain
MQQYVPAIVAAVLIAFQFILVVALVRSQPTVEPKTGFLVFRYHVLARGFVAVFAVGAPIAITALAIAKPPQDQDDYLALFGLFALSAALIVPMLWETMRFVLVVSPEGLDCRSPWRGRQFIRWDEVERMSHNSALSWYVIRAVGGRTIRVSTAVSGMRSFLLECLQQLPPDKLRWAKAVHTQPARPLPDEQKQA